jgi:hypothetical protein
MTEFKEGLYIGALFGVIITLVFFFACFHPKEYYKRGQIDAINGKIKYEIKVDSTWIEKKKVEEYE